MPSYDFVCTDCETRFETRMSISTYETGKGRACPACGSDKVERAFTAVNVIAGNRSGSSASSCACGTSSGFT